MNKLALLLCMIAPTVAVADKQFAKGKGATWDCTKDPVVIINHGSGSYTFKGTCTSLTVNGGKHKLAIERADTLTLNGAKNTVTIGTAGTIIVNGSKNQVTWKQAASGDEPTVTTSGTANKIEKAK